MTAFTEKRIVSALVLVFAAGLVASTFGLDFADLGGAFSPMFFPRIVLFALLALALLNLMLDLRAEAERQPIRLVPVLIVSVAMIVYVLAIPPLGYFAASTLTGAAILLTLGLRNPLAVLGLPAAAAGALVLLFNHMLKMPLPTSPVFWWV